MRVKMRENYAREILRIKYDANIHESRPAVRSDCEVESTRHSHFPPLRKHYSFAFKGHGPSTNFPLASPRARAREHSIFIKSSS